MRHGREHVGELDDQDAKALLASALSVLRLEHDEWVILADTRYRGRRFSLNFEHDIAGAVRGGDLVLVEIAGQTTSLRLGVVRSKRPTTTLDSAVVFEMLQPIPGSLLTILGSVHGPELRAPRDRLAGSVARLERVSPKLGEGMIAALLSDDRNGPVLTMLASTLRRPKKFLDARALQADAVSLAIKAFGGDEAASIALPGDATSLGTVRLHEDAVIEHDARWLPGWHLSSSALTGKATFERYDGKLSLFTANKRALEELFGVDLIYLNEVRRSLVMVQYKMMEPDGHSERGEHRQWLVRVDDTFKRELERMRGFDRDLEPTGDYRLSTAPFYLKMVRRYASAGSAGVMLSLGHFDRLLESDELVGERGGLRFSYSEADSHYLRSEGFVELVRSGYIGTRGATTDHLETLIQAALDGGRAVVAAIQSALSVES